MVGAPTTPPPPPPLHLHRHRAPPTATATTRGRQRLQGLLPHVTLRRERQRQVPHRYEADAQLRANSGYQAARLVGRRTWHGQDIGRIQVGIGISIGGGVHHVPVQPAARGPPRTEVVADAKLCREAVEVDGAVVDRPLGEGIRGIGNHAGRRAVVAAHGIEGQPDPSAGAQRIRRLQESIEPLQVAVDARGRRHRPEGGRCQPRGIVRRSIDAAGQEQVERALRPRSDRPAQPVLRRARLAEDSRCRPPWPLRVMMLMMAPSPPCP